MAAASHSLYDGKVRLCVGKGQTCGRGVLDNVCFGGWVAAVKCPLLQGEKNEKVSSRVGCVAGKRRIRAWRGCVCRRESGVNKVVVPTKFGNYTSSRSGDVGCVQAR